MALTYASLSEKARQELLAGRHVAILSIPNGDEAPFASPIWYGYEPGGDIRILIHNRSLKARRMPMGVRVSFTVHTEDPTLWTSAEGPVVSIHEVDFDSEFRTLVDRYIDDPAGQIEFMEQYRPIADEFICLTIRPERWRGNDLRVEAEV